MVWVKFPEQLPSLFQEEDQKPSVWECTAELLERYRRRLEALMDHLGLEFEDEPAKIVVKKKK